MARHLPAPPSFLSSSHNVLVVLHAPKWGGWRAWPTVFNLLNIATSGNFQQYAPLKTIRCNIPGIISFAYIIYILMTCDNLNPLVTWTMHKFEPNLIYYNFSLCWINFIPPFPFNCFSFEFYELAVHEILYNFFW